MDATPTPIANVTPNQVVCTDAGVNAGHSRRGHERVPCSSAATIYEIGDGDFVQMGCQCAIQDLSKSGLGFRSRRMYNVGVRVIVVVSAKSTDIRPYFGIIRQSRYIGNAMYAAGIEFIPAIQSKNITRWMVQTCGGR
jgi:hypothetical protein